MQPHYSEAQPGGLGKTGSDQQQSASGAMDLRRTSGSWDGIDAPQLHHLHQPMRRQPQQLPQLQQPHHHHQYEHTLSVSESPIAHFPEDTLSPAPSLSSLSSAASSLSSTPSSLSFEKERLNRQPQEWRRGRGFWRCFIAVCVPILLSAFEGSVVSTALPTISQALGLGPNTPWVATVFLLASIVCQPLYGQVADIWGRKPLMFFAVVLFLVGSLASGFAKTGTALIFGRIVQGMGSGGIDLFAELIICDIVPLRKRGHYVAIKAVVYAVGTTVGPLLGGFFAEVWWPWCFLINVPICVVALVMIWFWLQVENGRGWAEGSVTHAQRLRRIDFPGIGFLTSSVIMILFALSYGGASYAWTDPFVLGPLVGGFAATAVFAVWERCRFCTHPIMPPHIFSNRTTVAAFVITILHGFMTYGFQFYLPPFFQSVLGTSPAQSGVLILPCTLSIVIVSAFGGPLLARFGKYRTMQQVGFVIMLGGFVFCVALKNSNVPVHWILFSLLVGIGSGIVVPTTLPTVLVELSDKENAAATGSWAFLRGLGSLLGVAIPNAAFNAQFGAELFTITDGGARAQLANGQAYEHASADFAALYDTVSEVQIVRVYNVSFWVAWIIFAVTAAVGLGFTLMERQVPLRKELDSDFDLKQREKCEEVAA